MCTFLYTYITRPPRQSLNARKNNTVSGLVSKFSLMSGSTSDIADRGKRIGAIGRQASFNADFTTINEGSEDGGVSSNFVDSVYDSFRRRSQSVTSVNNQTISWKNIKNSRISSSAT